MSLQQSCVIAIIAGQALAAEAVVEWRGQAAPARHFVRNRNENRGLLQLVLRAWRERVEHEAPGVSSDSSRWRVREEKAGGRRTTRVTRPDARRLRPPSEEKKFVWAKLAQIEQLAASFAWSPWREGDTRAQRETDQNETGREDETQLERWRLRGDMLRVATYYRVTGAKRRAERRARREWAKARFRQWATTVLRDQRRQGMADEDAQRGQRTTGKRRAEGEPSYREARPYRQRATPEEMQRRRLGPKRTRLVSTAQSTELGKRLRENMEEIGRRCKERRGIG